MDKFLSQSDYAKHKGRSRGWISQLKKAGRLVLNDAGLVDVEKSNLLIDQTANPDRTDVASRHASERAGADTKNLNFNNSNVGGSLQQARAVKEKYAALQAKASYEEMIGTLVLADDVSAAIEDLSVTFRQALENMPHRLAPDLVGKDVDFIRGKLREETFNILSQLQKTFDQKIKAQKIA